MDYCELQEIRRALRTHEESIQGNRTSIFTATAKLHGIDQQVTTRNATAMGTLVQLKRKISILEAECNMLRNMVLNLTKGKHSRASNQVQSVNSNCEGWKEEETVHQLPEANEIIKLDSDPENVAMEDATSCHAFCLLNVL